MSLPTMDYHAWIKELKNVALATGYTVKGTNTNWEVFKDYYIDGYTPAEALLEDMSYA